MLGAIAFIFGIIILLGFYLFGPVDEINEKAKKTIQEVRKSGYTVDEIRTEIDTMFKKEEEDTELFTTVKNELTEEELQSYQTPFADIRRIRIVQPNSKALEKLIEEITEAEEYTLDMKVFDDTSLSITVTAKEKTGTSYHIQGKTAGSEEINTELRIEKEVVQNTLTGVIYPIPESTFAYEIKKGKDGLLYIIESQPKEEKADEEEPS